MRGIRHKAASMRKDDVSSRIPVHDPIQHKLNGCSRGIEWVVDERAGDTIDRGKRQSRMHEYDGLSAVKLGPERLKRCIAEVQFGVIAEENNPIGPKRVQRILEFGKSAIDVGKRQSSEVAKAVRSLGDKIRRVFVDTARHLTSFPLVPTDYARRGQREHSGCNILGVHQIDSSLG